MTIKQISAVFEPDYNTSIIYGLGDDDKIYVWNMTKIGWNLYDER